MQNTSDSMNEKLKLKENDDSKKIVSVDGLTGLNYSIDKTFSFIETRFHLIYFD